MKNLQKNKEVGLLEKNRKLFECLRKINRFNEAITGISVFLLLKMFFMEWPDLFICQNVINSMRKIVYPIIIWGFTVLVYIYLMTVSIHLLAHNLTDDSFSVMYYSIFHSILTLNSYSIESYRLEGTPVLLLLGIIFCIMLHKS